MSTTLTLVVRDYRGSVGASGLGGPCSPGLAVLIEQLEDARPAWMKDALCREYPEVSWYPERGESTAQAKAICQRCLVENTCRNYGIVHEEPAGHGVCPNDRRRLWAGRAA